MDSWIDYQESIIRLAKMQLFFVGGAPRSGTTWLQEILDSHPEVSCRGEGLFLKQLAAPLEAMMADRRLALDAKNKTIFRHSAGYPLPVAEDCEFLLGTAILTALARQSAGKTCVAVGEKTPENVFFFPRLKQLFPTAKLICIARDPRDVITSAWHFFHRPVAGEDEQQAKLAFIRSALPSIAEGARATIALGERHPSDCITITYETLRESPEPATARLFRFLGVADSTDLVQSCVAQTNFAAMAGARISGAEHNGSFFRKGVVGDWKATLTPEMNELLLQELGWMFPHFGWEP